MSTVLFSHAYEYGPRNPTEKLLLMAYAEHADWETGHCWPSDERLSAVVGISVSSIYRYREKLIEHGYLEKVELERTAGGRVKRNCVRMIFAKINYVPRTTGQSDRLTGQSDIQPPVNLTGGLSTGQSDRENIKKNIYARTRAHGLPENWETKLQSVNVDGQWHNKPRDDYEQVAWHHWAVRMVNKGFEPSFKTVDRNGNSRPSKQAGHRRRS